MLRQLRLRNIAIVDSLEIDFKPGLMVITGETGSGKSILLDAISLVFGLKTGTKTASAKTLIRHGQTQAQVELLFDTEALDKPERVSLQVFLEASGLSIDLTEDPEILLSRELTLKGSRFRLNGIPVPQELMQQLRGRLIDMHGQHELTNLFEATSQRAYLDAFAGQPVLTLKIEVAQVYAQWHQVKTRLAELTQNQADWQAKQQQWQEELELLTKAQLKNEDEDEQLRQQLSVLAHSEQLQQLIQTGLIALDQDNTEQSDTLQLLQQARKALSKAASLDLSLEAQLTELDGLILQTRTLKQQLGHYLDHLEANPQALEQINQRLGQLERLQHRFAKTLPELIAYQQELDEQLSLSASPDDERQMLEATEAHLSEQLDVLMEALTERRKESASKLIEALQQQLNDLAMRGVQFDVAFTQTDWTSEGQDQVAFLIAPNRGEPLKPLAKTASGGELARVLLAFKTLIAKNQGVKTLIFDEVDAGVSGTTAKALAEKLWQISRQAQVIAVTHQPMIAAIADSHWEIEKSMDETLTTVRAVALEGQTQRLQVLKRLMSGTAQDDPQFQSVLENWVQSFRQTLKG